ncbi:MAG: TetR/AcrR family transcriptional regulator, partial [Bacteroidetes bacterium]
SKANIFHHFNGKQELYLAVLERACARSVGMLEALDQPSCVNARPLREFARAHLEHLFDNADISRLILREVVDGDPERGQLMAGRVFGEHFRRLVALVRRGQAEGVLRPDMEAADAAACMVGLNVFLFQAWPVLRHLPEGAFDEPGRTGKRWQRLLLLGLANAGQQPGVES